MTTNELALLEKGVLQRADSAFPALIASSGERIRLRFLEFFVAQIRNANTRRAYARPVSGFLAWCADCGMAVLGDVTLLHVATWIELQGRTLSAPSVKQGLAALRHLFDWLVTGQVVAVNPAASVRGSARPRCWRRSTFPPCWAARPGADRADGVFLCPSRGGAGDAGGGCVRAATPAVVTAAGEERQAVRHACHHTLDGGPER